MGNIHIVEEKEDAREKKVDNVILPVIYKVPVTVEEEETMLTWTVDTVSEVRWHSVRILVNILIKGCF